VATPHAAFTNLGFDALDMLFLSSIVNLRQYWMLVVDVYTLIHRFSENWRIFASRKCSRYENYSS